MSESPYDGPVGDYPDYLPPMANCTECKQGYAKHVLDKRGVCPRCKLEKLDIPPNPAFESRPHPGLPERAVQGLAGANARPAGLRPNGATSRGS